MSNLEQLLKLQGAQVVGGAVLWKHKVLGLLRNGEFHITEDGKAALNVEDVEVKEIKADKPAKARAAKAPAAAKDYQAGGDLEIELE